MSYQTKSSAKKFVAGLLGLSMAVSFAFAGAVAPAQAATVEELTAQINSLLTTIASLQSQLSTMTGGSTAGAYTFSTNLTVGSKGTDVMNLQKVLNMSADTQVALVGAGSPGNESTYFGSLTKQAVMKFQAKYGISPVAGYVGPLTRAKLNTMGGVVVVPPGTTPPPASVGTGLSVAAGTQPAQQLAPANAARIPFTKIILTAGNDGDVTVNGITVERVGPALDAAFTGVVLLDENGNQLGLAKTLNSSHQATLSEPVVVKAGQSRTLTIGANRRAVIGGADAGGIAGFTVVAINTTATVNGSLPIMGTSQILNEGLTIGTVTVAKGPLDPNAQAGGVSKNVGTTAYIFSSLKVTAGSTENVLLKSVRWNQASSSASTDMANLVTVVDGTSYPTTVDSTGKYYTANFGAGIQIDKGFSKEISIKGDIIGGSGRTIAFNVEKTTDINLVGLTYGYGITPPTTGTGISAGSIWFAGSTISVNSGSLTVSSDPAVASQNIAVNVANQPLGGFQVDVKGEPISVARLVFGLDVVGPADNITNVSLVNQSGAILAGPVDQTNGVVTFTDTVTFPVGITKLVLRGKAGTNFANNNTVRASTTPSTNWTTVTGQTTSQVITPSPGSVIQGNTMTVKSAALTASVSAQPTAQTVVSGGQQFLFANFTLDAGASGEDLRVSSLSLFETGTATNLTGCQLYDGATGLVNTTIDPTAGANTFTFNSALIIPKGTTKTLALKCNIASGATGTNQWGMTSAPTATGQTSGQSATVVLNSSTGPLMTLTSGGTVSVAIDSSSPSYRVVTAGTTGNIASVLRFTATNEDLSLQTVALQLTSVATSTNADVSSVTLWDGATQVGSANFDGTTNASGLNIATSTLTTPVTIPANGSKIITVKVDLPDQGTNQAGHPGALVAVDWDGGGAAIGTKAVGASSGTTVYATGSDTAASGLRVFKTFPTITYSTAGATLISGVNDLLSVTVAADAKGDVMLNRLTFTISTTTASLTGAAVSFSGPNGNVSSSTNSILQSVTSGAADVSVYFDSVSNTADKTIPAGSSKTYTLRGTVALTGNSNQNGSISVALKADAGYAALPYLLSTSTTGYMASTTSGYLGSVSLNNANIIWSPLSTTTGVTTAYTDFANGYGLPGCFASSGLGQNCTPRVLSK